MGVDAVWKKKQFIRYVYQKYDEHQYIEVSIICEY